MSPQLEYFFDYVSPFSYLANSQVPGLVERTGVELVHRPFFLGGVMKAAGNSPPATVPAKGKYMSADLARWAKRYGLEMRFNPNFPINTVKLMRAALVSLEDGSFPAFHEAVFHAMWCEPVNLGDDDVVRGVLEKAGLDAAGLLDRATSPQVKDRLRSNTDEAVERGAFGSPTFFLGEEMFFGNDRLDFVEEALAQR